MSQDFSSRFSSSSSSSSMPPTPARRDAVVSLSQSRLESKQADKKEEKKSDQLPAAAVFTFAISFSELEEVAEYLEDKEAIRSVLADIKKGTTAIEKFFPIRNKKLYYPEIQQRLEAIQRLVAKIPSTPGLRHSIRDSIQKAIAPLQKEIHDFLLQEEGISDHQLLTKTQALYAQQAWIMRDETVVKALNQTLQAVAKMVTEGRAGQRCFISYAWPLPTAERQEKEHWLQPFLRELHTHLAHAGINPQLDIVNNQAGGNIVTFTNQITTSEFAVLICTESLLDKHNHAEFIVIQTELSLLRQKYDTDIRATGQVRVFPFLVSGSRATATLPEHHLYRTVRDWRLKGYVKNVEQLITWMYYPPPQTPPDAYQTLWRDFYSKYKQLADPMPDLHVRKELEQHWHRREMDNLHREAFYHTLLSQQEQSSLPLFASKDHQDKEGKEGG